MSVRYWSNRMLLIYKVCLVAGVLIPTLASICVYGELGTDTCTRDNAESQAEHECVSTENVESILHTETQTVQGKVMGKKDEAAISNTKENQAKVALQEGDVNRPAEKENIMDKAKVTRKKAEFHGNQFQDSGKVGGELKGKQKDAKTEKQQMEAKANIDKQKEQNSKGKKRPVLQPSADPKRLPSAVNKDIKKDNARRTEENKKIHLDIEEYTKSQAAGSLQGAQTDIHLAVQVCGDRMPETFVLLKSARMLSRVHLHFHVFVEEELKPQLIEEWESWPSDERKRTTMDMRPLSFPEENAKLWKGLEIFKTCATQRIFMPDLLVELDAVLYVDTDIVFMRPPEDIWRLFHHFNNSHIAGLTREHEEGTESWYNRYSRTPYVLPLGVNSGVILMNLTRMRKANWVADIKSFLPLYRNRLSWGDQDLINIFFHFKPELLFLFPCHWNFRSDHCMYGPLCPPAYEHGANLVHGSRRVFVNYKKPTFKVIYNTFKEHKFGEDLTVLIERLKENLAAPNIQGRRCGYVSRVIIKQLERQVSLTKSNQRYRVNTNTR